MSSESEIDDIQQEHEDYKNWLVQLEFQKQKPVSMEGTEQQIKLQPYFTMVCDKSNWKNPIDVQVPGEVPSQTLELIKEAIRFYTGSVALITRPYSEFKCLPWSIKAAGYYKTIGA
jgi:hypothetical protein